MDVSQDTSLDFRGERDTSAINRSFRFDRTAGQTGIILFILALLIRAIFLFITPNNGVDAWARYMYAIGWLNDPSSLPSGTANDAWLPFHFWLLGGALWFWKSEWTARVLTLLLGALTVFPIWALTRKIFGREIALGGTLALAIFGFHVGYSVTTSSEVPTICFLVTSLYCWHRYYLEPSWKWAITSGLLLAAACLTRFEAWLVPPVLILALLDYSKGWRSLRSSVQAWRNAVRFAIPASSGVIGWMLFSWEKWGDPMKLPHRTIAENTSKIAELHHGMGYRLAVVPGALIISLSPLLAALAAVGLIGTIWRGTMLTRSLACLFLALMTFNYYNSVRHEVTQAKYTLVYSWLCMPFAFLAVAWITSRWRLCSMRCASSLLVLFFLLWQSAVAVGSIYAPPSVADRLGVLSVTLPLKTELRGLVAWLKINDPSGTGVILDDYNYEGTDIIRFSHISPSDTFSVKIHAYHDPDLKNKIAEFVTQHKPRFCICSPDGPIGRALSLRAQRELQIPSLNVHLIRLWEGVHWAVFSIVPTESGEQADPSFLLRRYLFGVSVSTRPGLSGEFTRTPRMSVRKFENISFAATAWSTRSTP